MSDPGGTWFYPEVPSVPRRERVDLGPAGSLKAARPMLRAARRAHRIRFRRDPRAIGAALLVVVALALAVLTSVAVGRQSPGGAVVGGAGAVAAAGAAGLLLMRRYGGTPAEEFLDRTIHHETRLAAQLEQLTAYGWTVLADRLVPGGEARVPFVLVGPAGVVIVTPAPAAGPWKTAHDEVFLEGRPLGAWVQTRWWEATTVNDAIGAAAQDVVFTGPTYPVIAVPSAQSGADIPNHPRLINAIPVIPYRHIIQGILDLPAPLPREAAANLAVVASQVCVPAGVKQPPK